MGYQMEYEMQTIRLKYTNKKKDVLRYTIVLFSLLIGAICLHFGSAVLEGMLLGRGNNASVAAEKMVQEIQNGATLAEAVEVFCSEVGE